MSLQYAFLSDLQTTNETFEERYNKKKEKEKEIENNKRCELFEKTFPKLKSKNLIKQKENCTINNGCTYYLYPLSQSHLENLIHNK